MKKACALFVALLCIAIQAEMKLFPENWSRQPMIGVPLLDKKPVIDGKVTDEEWDKAFMTSALYSKQTGTLAETPTKLYLGHRNGNLYVAWQITRPKNSPKPRTMHKPGYHSSIWQARDMVEMVIECGLREDGLAQMAIFAGNANSAWSDAILGLEGYMDATWKGSWQYFSRKTNFGWEGELMIPADLYKKAYSAKPGNQWRFDFIVNRETPGRDLLCLANVWSYGGSYQNLNKAVLNFLSEPKAVKLENIGKLEDGGIGFKGRTIGTDATINYQIFAGVPPNESQKSFFDVWDRFEHCRLTGEKIREGSQVIFYKDAEQYQKDINKRFDFIQSGQLKTNSESEFKFKLPEKYSSGEFAIGWQINDNKNNVLLNQATSINVPSPLATDITEFFLEKKKLRVLSSVSNVNGIMKGDVISFKLFATPRESMISSRQIIFDGEKTDISAFLDTERLNPGNYIVRVGVSRADRILMERSFNGTRHPNPIWWNNKLGFASVPPKPWPPLETSSIADDKLGSWYPVTNLKHQVSVWERDIYFGESFLPELIIARGEKLVNKPVTLELEVDGEKQILNNIEFKEIAKDKMEVEYIYSGESQKLKLQATIKVEYDGLIRTRLKIMPRGTNVSLDKLSLKIPIQKDHALFYRHADLYTAVSQKSNSGLGTVSDWDKKYSEGLPFTYSLFVGNSDRGIEWLAENDRYWSNCDESKAIFIEETKDTRDIRINFVDKPMKLETAVIYDWGMMPLPIKDASRGHYKFGDYSGAAAHIGNFQDGANKLEKELEIVRKGYFNVGSIYANMNKEGHFGSPRPYSEKWLKCFKQTVKRLKGANENIKIPYYSSWGVNPRLPDVINFFPEMLMEPLFDCGFGNYWHNAGSKAYQDWYLYNVKWMLNEIKVDGPYLDGTFTIRLLTNELYDYGFQKNGQLHGSYPVFGVREFAKRLYSMTHGGVVEDGIVSLHGDGAYSTMAYSDVLVLGESEYQNGDTVNTVCTLDDYRIKFATWQLGIASNMLWPGWANLTVKRNEIRSLSLLHDTRLSSYFHYALTPWQNMYEREAEPWGKITEIFKSIERATAKWIPYWKNNKIIWTDNSEIIGSIYLPKNKKTRALVILSNRSEKGFMTNLHFDKGKLGFVKPRIRVIDAFHEVNITPEKKDGAYKIQFYPQSYRIFEIVNY